MEVKTRTHFFKNKYLEYREMVSATKNFSRELDQAKAPDFPKPADVDTKTKEKHSAPEKESHPKSKALSSGAKAEAKPKATASEEMDSVGLNEAPLNISIPDSGAADDRMLGKLQEYEPLIRAAANRYNLPPELIAGVVWQESRGNSRAVSHCGAMGLMQLMPATAANLGVSNAFDPIQCIDGGAKYLRQMLDKFGRVEFAVAAYNAGPGNVSKFGGVPPFAETQNYVPKVLGFANSFKVAGAFQQMSTPTAVRV